MLTLILKISLLIFMSGSASNTPIFDVESSSASVEIIDTLEALESRSYYEDWPCHHGNPYQIYDQYIAIQTDYTLPSYCPEIEGAMWVYGRLSFELPTK